MVKKYFLLFLLLGSCLAHASLSTREFVSGGSRFRSEEGSNFKYPFWYINEDKLLLITHSSIYWDQNKRTWEGIKLLADHFQDHSMRYLVSSQERAVSLASNAPFYPPGVNDEDLYPFQGDSHRIVTRGDQLVIAGGNFTICACNAARSAIALSETVESLNVYFPLDAVYEGELGTLKTLEEISERYTDHGFMKYLRENFFNSDGLPCKEATLFAIDKKFSFTVFRQGRLIGTFGKGSDSVILHFDKTAEVIKKLRSSR
jgi:hypothetical protein